jgi:hypothetical protein
VFKRKEKYRLKEVFWYAMRTTYTGPLTPQLDEGIEKVKWKNPEQITKALTKSYTNIRILFGD